MKKAVLYLLITGTILACNSNTISKKPTNLIPQDKMVEILTDTYIAKSAKNVKNIHKQKNINYSAFIYKKHNTDSITFNKSLRYYITDISKNEEILELVQISINERLDKLKKEQNSALTMQFDSINNSRKKETELSINTLQETEAKKLIKITDSINTLKNAVFDKKISTLKHKINNKSIHKKDTFVSDINKRITDLELSREASIKKIKDSLESISKTIIDKKIKIIKEEEEKFLRKKKKEFERKKS